MIVKVETTIVVEVEDDDQAERACATLDAGLEDRIADFPQGEIVAVDVSGYEIATEEEIGERGWEE